MKRIKFGKFSENLFLRYFIIIIGVIVLPLIILNIVIYNFYNNKLITEIEVANNTIITRIGENVDDIINEVNKLSYSIIIDDDVKVFTMNKISNNDMYYFSERINNISNKLDIYKYISKAIDSVYIYSELNNYAIGTNGSGSIEKINDKGWIDNYFERKDKDVSWISSREYLNKMNNYKTRYMSIYRVITNNDIETKGLVIINIDFEKMNNLIKGIDLNRYNNILLLDRKCEILYSSNNFDKNNSKYQLIKNYIGNTYNIEQIKTIPLVNDNLMLTILPSTNKQYFIVSLIDMKNYYYNANMFKYFIILQIILVMIIVAVIVYVIINKIYQPIKGIIRVLDSMNDNNEDNNTNEFKYILNTINKRNQYITELEDELYKRLIAFNNARIYSLQSQINPHFIYNTLESINWKAIEILSENNAISKLIKMLSSLLRISFKNVKSVIDINEEIEYVKKYIDILKIRYDDKFDVKYNIDNTVLEYKTVKMSLQPLVENAIYHGIKEKKGKGLLEIKAYKNDEYIIFEVIDNGVGIEEGKLYSINNMLNSINKFDVEKNENIGLYNVNIRIKILFGDIYGVRLESVYREYTKAIIKLPLQKEFK